MTTEMLVPVLDNPHGELPLKQASHPLLREGYNWTKEVQVTSWGGVLPTVAFSRAAFRALELLTDQKPESEKERRAKIAAEFFIKREKIKPAEFDSELGCWLLPLTAEFDDKKRARYPRATIKALGWKAAGTHQVAFQELRGIIIPSSNGTSAGIKRHPVDHLCHNHACCNPYHLDCVEHEVNTARGATVRRNKIQPEIFFPGAGNIAVSKLTGHDGYCLTERLVVQ